MFVLFDLFGAIVFPEWLDETIVEIGPVALRWYGLSYIVGLFGAYFYAARVAETGRYWVPSGPTRAPQIVPTREDLSDLMFYAFFGIILGGRIGWVILYGGADIWSRPLDILKVWEGGMSFHGGFLGVCAAVGYAAWRKKTSYMRFADLAWIGAPIGLGLVRIANFINQELYGRVTDVPWAFIFETDFTSQPRHPSQLYEAFLEGFLLWFILRLMTKRGALTKPGLVTGAGVAGYGLFRFSVEFVREPDATLFGPLTRGMAYSLPMVLIGVAVMIWAYRRQAVAPVYAARLAKTAAEEPAEA
ncbi:MAG: prolipoprotein diacylglyceryl transferase [Litorimonas sp.]